MESSGSPSPDARKQAIDSLNSKRAFKTMLVMYVVVNAALVVIWALSGGDYFWPIWVIGGWGIGVVVSAWNIYGRKPLTESEIEQETQKLNR